MHFLFVAAFSVCFIFQIKITLPVIRVLSQTNDQLSSLHHSIPINDEEVKVMFICSAVLWVRAVYVSSF